METFSLNFLIKDSTSTVAIVDSQMRFINHSKLWLQELDIKNPDIVGKSYYDVIPNTPLELKKIHEIAIKETASDNYIQKIIQPNGGLKWINWRINGWSDDESGHKGLVIVAVDITEDKRKEELFLKVQQVAKIGGWQMDLITNEIYLSDTTKEIHEMPLDHVTSLEEGINFYKKGEHRDKITEIVTEAIANGTSWDIESIIVTAKGNQRWVRSMGECEMVNNTCVRIFGTIQDIDQKKRIELQHQEISERLKIATTHAAKIGIWELNIQDKDVIWDDNMYRLYGLGKSDFSGTYEAWEAAVHPKDKIRSDNEIALAIAGKKDFNSEFRIVWPNGEIRHIRAEAIIRHDNNGTPIRMIGANWDITEDKNAERKLKSLLEITSDQNKSLLNFAHIVSHNLRSHSSNLSMLSGFLAGENNEDEKKNLIMMLNDASNGLNETVVHLSEVVNVKANTFEKLKKTNLRQAIKNVENNIGALLQEKKAICHIDIDESLFIQAVPAYLDSILLNLFTNSLKYSSPKRTPVIRIVSKQEKDKVMVTFKDNGLGIDLEKHGKKIFGMYKTFHRHADAKGIGLFITKNQIEAMNGKIEVESTVGIGTTFKINFESNQLNNTI